MGTLRLIAGVQSTLARAVLADSASIQVLSFEDVVARGRSVWMQGRLHCWMMSDWWKTSDHLGLHKNHLCSSHHLQWSLLDSVALEGLVDPCSFPENGRWLNFSAASCLEMVVVVLV